MNQKISLLLRLIVVWLTTPNFKPTYRELEQTAPFVLIAIESDTAIKLIKYQ